MSDEFKVGDYFKWGNEYWQVMTVGTSRYSTARCLTSVRDNGSFDLEPDCHDPVTKVELNAFEKAVYGIES